MPKLAPKLVPKVAPKVATKVASEASRLSSYIVPASLSTSPSNENPWEDGLVGYTDSDPNDPFSENSKSQSSRQNPHQSPSQRQLVSPLEDPLSKGRATLCSMPLSRFEGVSRLVPPGSHYDEWVWNAMDRPDHVTIEIYVDYDEAVGMKNMDPLTKNPVFDPNYHCLISVPQTNNAPWMMAKRVLLTPKTFTRVNASPLLNPSLSQADTKPKAAPESIAHPQGLSRWLRDDWPAEVLFGSCTLCASGDGKKSFDRDYWMVLPLDTVQLIHERVYGDSASRQIDPRQNFGFRGIEPQQTKWVNNRPVETAVEPEHRTPVAPALRYFGVWSDPMAAQVIEYARSAAGPMLHGDWPQEDVAFVRLSHASLQKAAQQQESEMRSTILPPLKASRPQQSG
jgi:hypothetical protein